jgi:hypothetical protein
MIEMSTKSKLIYLKILMNIKNNVYSQNQAQLKNDLLMIKRLLIIENQDKTNLQKIEKNMQKLLTKAS